MGQAPSEPRKSRRSIQESRIPKSSRRPRPRLPIPPLRARGCGSKPSPGGALSLNCGLSARPYSRGLEMLLSLLVFRVVSLIHTGSGFVAVRGDPERCAYSLCLRRLLHTGSVFIFKTYAYVGTLDEHGNKIFERYRIKGAARQYVGNFDAGKGIGPSSFSLHPPAPSDTLDARQASDAKRRIRKAKICGTVTKKKPSPLPQSTEHKISFLRSGTGMVHFRGTEDGVTTRLHK